MSTNFSVGGTSFDKYYVTQAYLNQFVTTGSLWGWGDNSWGILGNNTTTYRSSPVQTTGGGTNWLNTSNSLRNATSIKTDGVLWTWGDNTYGQLGSNTTVSRSSPQQLTGTGSSTWRTVSTGYLFTSAIKQSGQLWTWGRNQYGQLGQGASLNRSSPVQTIVGGVDWTTCVSGQFSSAAIKTDGSLWTWGRNNSGQLGTDSQSGQMVPNQIAEFKWTQLDLGQRFAGGVKSDGRLWMWGSNYPWGQLGTGNLNGTYSPVQTISGGTNWKQVSCGGNSTVAVKTDGTLWTWGSNFFGELGDGTQGNRKSSPIQTFAGGTNWSSAAISNMPNSGFVLAIKTDGTLWSWGSNGYGELGTGSSFSTGALSPVQTISGGSNWKQVACGWGFSAAVKTDGSLWMWGSNTDYNSGGAGGQLGDGTSNNRNSPVQTSIGGTDWSSVSAGQRGDFTAAIKTDGTLWTWGRNDYGQLGTNNTTSRSTPDQTIAGGTTWAKVSAGGYSCIASKTDGTLWGWGSNSSNTIGDGTSTNRSSPVQTGLPGTDAGTDWLGFLPVKNGFYATGALKTNNSMWLWGSNYQLQLGPITTQAGPVTTDVGTAYPMPAPADSSKYWQQASIGANGQHMAAITDDGKLWTWGLNSSGQLGDNTTVNKSSPIQTISGGTNWLIASAGSQQTGAIKTDGSLWTWGQNSTGALGDNTIDNKSSPVQTVSGGTNWKQVSMGSSFSSGLKTDGTLWTWGYNQRGQLGNNTTSDRSSPIQTINGGNNWKSVVAGDNIIQGIYFLDAGNMYPS